MMVTKVTLVWIYLPDAVHGESVHYFVNYDAVVKCVSAWNSNRVGKWAYAIKSAERVVSPFGAVTIASNGQVLPIGVDVRAAA